METTVRVDPRRLMMVAAIAVALVIGVYGAKAYSDGLPPFGPSDDAWSGVFLTNGQAYFGHFYASPGEYAVLRDVYYVLAQQLQSQDPQQNTGTQLTLQQLGGEIHGPKQEMRISKQQILFVEELRRDSPLVSAIAQYKSSPPTPRPAAPVVPVPTGAPATASPAPASPSPSAARTTSPSPSR